MSSRNSSAAQRWAEALGQWGIPDHILEQAPQSPWIHPVESFRPTGNLHVDTPSRRRALEVLDSDRPSVLDVGCGGGRASLALVPPARLLVGVDHQQQMLDVFTDETAARGAEAITILGDWPAVADRTPVCDVVVCHHVFYNVRDLVAFAAALTDHAHRRVVVELPQHHPLSHLSDGWLRFWGLVRPTSPTADDALEVLHEMGVDARAEPFTAGNDGPAAEVTDLDVEHTRVRLCLPASRDPEVREFLESRPQRARRLVTLWWDVTG